MRREMNQGIAHHQGARGRMKIGGFLIPRTRKRDGLKRRGLIGQTGVPTLHERFGLTVMIGVGFYNLDDPLWFCVFPWPIDGIKEDRDLRTEIGGGPEFRLTGGVVSVPGEKALSVILEGLGMETQWGRVAV